MALAPILLWGLGTGANGHRLATFGFSSDQTAIAENISNTIALGGVAVTSALGSNAITTKLSSNSVSVKLRE